MYLLKWISHGSSPLPDNGFPRFVQPDQLRFVGILDEQFFFPAIYSPLPSLFQLHLTMGNQNKQKS